MALLNVDFFSYYLGMDTPLTVLLPEKRGKKPVLQEEKKYPVLYLLHGHADDNTAWIRKSNIELLIRDYDVIVVMPTAHRGFYTNAKHGYQYMDYLVKELPVVVANMFHASTKREDTYIAGYSMGGYGAIKLALTYPEIYGHAASMSGASDIYKSMEKTSASFSVEDYRENIDNVFGGKEKFYHSENELKYLAKKIQTEKPLLIPQLYMCCGRQDVMWETYNDLKKFMQEETDIKVTYDEMDGAHNWNFWNAELPRILQFFQLISEEKTGM